MHVPPGFRTLGKIVKERYRQRLTRLVALGDRIGRVERVQRKIWSHETAIEEEVPWTGALAFRRLY